MTIIDVIFARLIKRIENVELVARRMGTRQNNLIREAVVQSVDYEKGLAVVNAHGVESKPVPWTERAGDIVEWSPLSPGQRVMLFSPNGDIGRAFILPGGFTDQVPQPLNKKAHKRTRIGGATVTQSTDGLNVEIGGATYEFTADGLTMNVGGSTFAFTAAGFTQTGGAQKHDGMNVGSDHTHSDVFSGPANTGPPNP